jgi:hypothetical protein
MSEQSQSSISPPPGADGGPGNAAGGPSPLTVGKRFVKQYYQVLSKTPDQIFRFYQPTLSYLSHAEGSMPTDPSTFESYDITKRWGAGTGAESKSQRFELEHGAIDAQPSVNGSILLVVTGHVVFVTDSGEDRRAFVHTFFLNLLGTSKRFYVHNDVLRFLSKEQPEAFVSASSATATELAVPEQPKEETPVEQSPPEPEPQEEKQQQLLQPEDDAPGGGVEETKEAAPEEEEEPVPSPPVEEPVVPSPPEEPVPASSSSAAESSTPPVNGNETKEEPPKVVAPTTTKGKKQKGRGRSPPQLAAPSQKQQPASKPAPVPVSSWASLVASGGAPSSAPVVAPSPAKAPPAPEKSKAEPVPELKPAAPVPMQENKDTSKGDTTRQNRGDRPKRDPDCTLVVKNLADNTKESDLVSLFEPFATQTKAKIVGTTVASHRGLAFVDYDSVAAVMAAVEQHAKEPLQLNGRVLEVDQKTAEQRARRNVRGSGGGYRSGSPGNTNGGTSYRGSGSGGGGQGGNAGGSGGGSGRQNQYRRGDRDRPGNRGGGGRSGGGGAGGRGGRGART